MPVQVKYCQHESIGFDSDCSIYNFKECGKEFDVKSLTHQEIAGLLKNLPDYRLVHREPASVSCYSPVQFKPKYPVHNPRSGCSLSIGHLIILALIGFIIYLIIHFVF